MKESDIWSETEMEKWEEERESGADRAGVLKDAGEEESVHIGDLQHTRDHECARDQHHSRV